MKEVQAGVSASNSQARRCLAAQELAGAVGWHTEYGPSNVERRRWYLTKHKPSEAPKKPQKEVQGQEVAADQGHEVEEADSQGLRGRLGLRWCATCRRRSARQEWITCSIAGYRMAM